MMLMLMLNCVRIRSTLFSLCYIYKQICIVYRLILLYIYVYLIFILPRVSTSTRLFDTETDSVESKYNSSSHHLTYMYLYFIYI